jgi:hypothetical protein
MKRLFALFIVVLLLAACGAPAATPATQAPAQQPAAARPTEAPAAARAQPAQLLQPAPLPTLQLELKPPPSGGVLIPSTIIPTVGNLLGALRPAAACI